MPAMPIVLPIHPFIYIGLLCFAIGFAAGWHLAVKFILKEMIEMD